MSGLPFKIKHGENIVRIESDKVKKCEYKREQKLWVFVKYIHFSDEKCTVIQIYPYTKKYEIPLKPLEESC